MIRLYLVFFILFGLFYFGLPALRNMSGKEKWNLTKTIFYSIICTVLAIASMALIVILF